MPLQQNPHEQKLHPVVIAVVLCALILLGAAIMLLSEKKPHTPSPSGSVGQVATSTVTVETSSKKMSTPEAFKADESMADRRATLLDLARQSKTRKLTAQEKTYILQEFGGDRTARYTFSNAELKLIVDALNR